MPPDKKNNMLFVRRHLFLEFILEGWTENAGPENERPKKMKELKMQD